LLNKEQPTSIWTTLMSAACDPGSDRTDAAPVSLFAPVIAGEACTELGFDSHRAQVSFIERCLRLLTPRAARPHQR
jgi:hypothetical protein